MQAPIETNESGFALVLELVVVALVVTAVGFGFYQYSQHSGQVATVPTSKNVSAVDDANAAIEKSVNAEVTQSNSTDVLASELADTDASASSELEGGISESSF